MLDLKRREQQNDMKRFVSPQYLVGPQDMTGGDRGKVLSFKI
jgi:hypothetical protein